MKKFKVGLQLFGIRDKMNEDVEAALKAVKEMGYDYVEFAGYHDKSAEELKEILDKNALEAVSVHRLYDYFDKDIHKEIEFLKILGVKYCALPFYPLKEFFANWDETIDKFKRLGEELSSNGIKLLYHNHYDEFNKLNDDVTVLEELYNSISNDILQPEFDTCWIHYAGNNPAEYLRRYSGKTEVVHLKDFVCEKLGDGPVYSLMSEVDNNTAEKVGLKLRPVGYGVQDWKTILDSCEEKEVEYLIVEQDQSYGVDSLECAAQSRKYLKDVFGI